MYIIQEQWWWFDSNDDTNGKHWLLFLLFLGWHMECFPHQEVIQYVQIMGHVLNLCFIRKDRGGESNQPMLQDVEYFGSRKKYCTITLVVPISVLHFSIVWIDKSEIRLCGESSNIPRSVAINFFSSKTSICVVVRNILWWPISSGDHQGIYWTS